MSLFKKAVRLFLAGALLSGAAAAHAAAVTCGGPTGIRVTTVDPGLPGGLCYTQLGNIQNSDWEVGGALYNAVFTAYGAPIMFIEKDALPAGSSTGDLTYTTDAGGNSGTWGLNGSLWGSFERLFLGFHFGGAGDRTSTNPDSFVVELISPTTGGTWELGPDAAKLTGLSNIYVWGVECRSESCSPPPSIPEPASLALLGLGLAALAASRRRRRD